MSQKEIEIAIEQKDKGNEKAPPMSGESQTNNPADLGQADLTQLFLEELRQLHLIIARFEDHTFKIRNWLYAFIGGLGVLLYAKDARLTWLIFLLAGLLATILFLWIEVYHRVQMMFAIMRSDEIEKEFSNRSYKSMGISDAMRRNTTFHHIKDELKLPLLYIPYIVALLAIAIIAISARFTPK
jgi:hypothetical protein